MNNFLGTSLHQSSLNLITIFSSLGIETIDFYFVYFFVWGHVRNWSKFKNENCSRPKLLWYWILLSWPKLFYLRPKTCNQFSIQYTKQSYLIQHAFIMHIGYAQISQLKKITHQLLRRRFAISKWVSTKCHEIWAATLLSICTLVDESTNENFMLHYSSVLQLKHSLHTFSVANIGMNEFNCTQALSMLPAFVRR